MGHLGRHVHVALRLILAHQRGQRIEPAPCLPLSAGQDRLRLFVHAQRRI